MSRGGTAERPEPGEGDDEPIGITVPSGMQAGVWANWATLNESDHEFTLDFARIDHSVDPNIGVLVARIGMSPKLLRQLCDVLTATWDDYASRITDDVLPDPTTDGDKTND